MNLRNFFVIFFILTDECIQSKKVVRSLVVIQDQPTKGRPITDFTVFDSSEKKQLYRLRSSTKDIDTLMVVDYPAKNMIGNAEGEWIDGKVNATLTIYDQKSAKWIEGTIQRQVKLSPEVYRMEWNKEIYLIRIPFLSKTIKISKERPDELMAYFRHRARWLNKLKYNYDLKIYSAKLPDAFYLLALSIIHHKDPRKTSN